MHLSCYACILCYAMYRHLISDTNLSINKNRGAVVNRALEKRGLSAKRDSPTLQQIYEKRSI